MFRTLAFCGFIALSIGTTMNIQLGCNDNDTFAKSLLYPYTSLITPIVNGTCAVLSLIFCFLPLWVPILAVIMVVQAVYDVLTGYYILGIFIYAFCIIIMFSLGLFRSHSKKKFCAVVIFWLATLSTMIPSYGINAFLFADGISLFAIASYASIYRILSDQLSFLVHDVTVPDCRPIIALPAKGSTLDLHALNLSERQISCIHYTLDSSWNYKRIADVLCTSESTVKKEMQELYRLFGVKNRELLRLLLIQYKII